MKAKNISSSWKKFERNLSSSDLDFNQESEEEHELEHSKNASRSTLSLHIEAYENSFDADSTDSKCSEKEEHSKSKTTLIKKRREILKPSFNDLTLFIQVNKVFLKCLFHI